MSGASTTARTDRWFLKYICGVKDEPQFYSSYGSFIHKLIDGFYSGKYTRAELPTKFLTGFMSEVHGERPQESTVVNYINQGKAYFSSFEPFPFNTIATEKKLNFEIDGIPLVGVIDYLGERDGELYVVDNKSRDMKPRSKRKKPTAKDAELDEMLIQLYLYAAAVRQEYGVFPKSLCFNCFRTGVFIEEPFDPAVYEKAVRYIKDGVARIENEDDFGPYIDYFACRYICGVHHECCYYDGR